MRSLASSKEALGKPAPDGEELIRRLSPYIGSVVAVGTKLGDKTYKSKTVGVLHQLMVVDNPDLDEIGLGYQLLGDSGLRVTDLTQSFEVLIDGQWKIVHQPEDSEPDSYWKFAESSYLKALQ